MATSDPAGTDWSDYENDLIVADYFGILNSELGGERPNKAEHNRALQELTRRSRGSIERKHQNISAVLQKLGLPWILGYKPLPNFQNTLIAGIERYLSSAGEPSGIAQPVERVVAEPKRLYVESTPALQPTRETETPALRRLLSKYDPAARDARNRALGRSGEELALVFERDRLREAGRS